MKRSSASTSLPRLAALLALAAVLVRPVSAAVWDEYAVRWACPLAEADLDHFRWQKFHPNARGPLLGGATDPWRRPFRFVQEGIGTFVYSTGRDGFDDLGDRSGDDVFVDSTTLTRSLDRAPWWLLAATLVVAWMAAGTRVLRAPRSPRLAVELGRALVLALVPAGALGALALWAAPPYVRGASTLVVPFPVAVAGSGVLLVVLLALWARAQVPAEHDRPPRPWRRALLPWVGAGAVMALGAGTTAWRDLRRERWHGERVLMLAQLGVPRAVEAACLDEDLGVRDALLAHPPPVLSVNDSIVEKIAPIGPQALALILGALAGPYPNEAAIVFVREHDPELRALAERIEKDPAEYDGALRRLAPELTTTLGLRGVLGRLVARLERGEVFARDSTAQTIVELVGPDPPLGLPRPERPLVTDYDRVVRKILSWWRAGAPDLQPLRQLVLVVRRGPSASSPGDRPVNVRLESSDIMFLSGDVVGRTWSPLPLYDEGSVTVRLLLDGVTHVAIPVDAPPDGCTVFVTVDWPTREHEVRVVRHPD